MKDILFIAVPLVVGWLTILTILAGLTYEVFERLQRWIEKRAAKREGAGE